MSGTNSVDDVASLGRLGLEVYRKCRDCPGDYRNLAGACREISNTCTDVEDAIRLRPPSQRKEAELLQIARECRGVLQDLEELVQRYNDLPVQSRRTWDRLHWDQQQGPDIGARLKEASDKVANFYTSLSQSSQVQIEEALEQLAKEIRGGRADATSVVTLGTAPSDESDDSGWSQVSRDLQDMGISEEMAAENKGFIVDWILRAINEGWLEEKIPITEANSPPAILTTPPPIPAKIPSPAMPPRSPVGLHSTQNLSHQRSLSHQPSSSRQSTLSHQRSLRYQISDEDLRGVTLGPDDRPPSPIEPESNIIWTAQRAVEHWNRREWAAARNYLFEQIVAVESGQTIVIGNARVAPDVRILRHLLGICYSYEGDFVKAKETFEGVLRGVFIGGIPLDDGDVAAARWLGETCIMLNEPQNAALAWAISVYGTLNKYGPSANTTPRTMQDLRLLNQTTGGLSSLRNTFQRYNRDASTILDKMPATDKYHIVLTAIENVMGYGVSTSTSAFNVSFNVTIAEGFLTKPLVSQNSWPFAQDPYFRANSAIQLISILSRPKTPFPFVSVTQTTFGGGSKNLVYVTKLGIEWLVDTIRTALNAYAIEWKINGAQFLCRVGHSHEHIAYYEVYGIRFKKLPFRSVYGFKISERLYSTRGFLPHVMNANVQHRIFVGDEQHMQDIQQTLGDRLKEFLVQAERYKAEGKIPPWEVPLPPKAPYEMPATISFKPRGVELPTEGVCVFEMPSGQLESRELGGQEVFIAELPGDTSYR